jgi:hypothetical protein
VIEDHGSDCTVIIDRATCSKCVIVDCPSTEASGPGTKYAIDCSHVLEREATFACGEGDELTIFAAISNSLYYNMMCEGDTFRVSQLNSIRLSIHSAIYHRLLCSNNPTNVSK